jgi:hypothetical protein
VGRAGGDERGREDEVVVVRSREGDEGGREDEVVVVRSREGTREGDKVVAVRAGGDERGTGLPGAHCPGQHSKSISVHVFFEFRINHCYNTRTESVAQVVETGARWWWGDRGG